MTIIVFTPVRLFGDGLGACLGSRAAMTVDAVVSDFACLRERLAVAHIDIVLVDVTQAINPFEIRSIATEWPQVKLIALGLMEERQEVIRAGRSGFAGYVSRDASLDALCQSLRDLESGRVAMPPEIAGGLLQALFHAQPAPDAVDPDAPLTRREGEVLALLGQGLSNKEIGNELCLSVATVKHHVHHVLGKLKLPRRAQAMRKVRDTPWMAQPSMTAARK
jgi:two-component system, NarL family, nitrate/nitrite response regulator NarL